MGVNFWALYSSPVVFLSSLSSVLHHLDSCSLTVSLEVRWFQSSDFILLQNWIGCSGSEVFFFKVRSWAKTPVNNWGYIYIYIYMCSLLLYVYYTVGKINLLMNNIFMKKKCIELNFILLITQNYLWPLNLRILNIISSAVRLFWTSLLSGIIYLNWMPFFIIHK